MILFKVYDNIFTSNQILENKIKSLIEDNFNKEKYSLMLNQKYELATEENNFLKNKIMQEKTNICEQINELQKQNLSSHFEMIQNLLAELNDKKQNFFSIKFTDSFNELTSFRDLACFSLDIFALDALIKIFLGECAISINSTN